MAPPQVDGEYREQITRARKELGELIISNKKHFAPLMLYLALHDAGIYGFHLGTEYLLKKRGPNGSIRTPKELDHRYNKDLQEAVDICEKVKNNNNKITYADLYQLAGVAAVQITGGPEIEFVPGREDFTEYPEEYQPPTDNKETGSDESKLEKMMVSITKRMGLEEKDMVALFGGLHQWTLPVKKNGQESTTPDDKKAELKFGNGYFRDLQNREPDNLLLKVPRFNKLVETYKEDVNAFWKDYKAAHKKVSELGMSRAKAAQDGGGTQTDQKPSASASRNRVRLLQGIGIAVATTAIILGFFLSRRSK